MGAIDILDLNLDPRSENIAIPEDEALGPTCAATAKHAETSPEQQHGAIAATETDPKGPHEGMRGLGGSCQTQRRGAENDRGAAQRPYSSRNKGFEARG